MTDIIYCASGNKRFQQIALGYGFKYGARLPGTIYYPLYFADQDWKKPNRAKYMGLLAQYRPHMATILDWEYEDQLEEVLDWADEAAQYVSVIVIIPKVTGRINCIPRVIGKASVRLGYSVPTKFGATDIPVWEFSGWPVHLLGGSPHGQLALASYLDVRSVDGNYAQKKAVKWCECWLQNGKWVKIADLDRKRWEQDAPYEAFRRSCENIMSAWKKFDLERKN